MCRIKFSFIFFVLVIALLAAVNANAEKRTIEAGGITTFPAAGVTKVTVENSSVVKVEAADKDTILIIRAIRNGVSNVTFTYQDGRVETHTIRVTGGSGRSGRGGSASAYEVEELLQGIKGITIKQAGSKVVIDGHILNDDDARRIDKIVKEVFPGGVVVMADSDYQIMKQIDNILIVFHVVEVRKGKGGQLGMRWGALVSSTSIDIGGLGMSGAKPSGSISVHAGVDRFLQAMMTDGFGKIHDINKIITQNGKEAKYLVGGEVGFKTYSREAANVIYKVYGTDITVKPRMDKAGNIQIELKAEISALAGMSKDGVPNLTKNNIQNVVQLKEGQSIALSGMISKIGREDVERLPGLGHIPGLGSLFSSKDFQKGDSEAVIFITAKRIKADDQENIDMIKKPQIRFKEIDENWWERK